MNNGKIESNEANAETEDPDEECKYGPAKLKETAEELVAVNRGSGRTRRVPK